MWQKNIGWRDQSRKLIVVTTDGDFHLGGDGMVCYVYCLYQFQKCQVSEVHWPFGHYYCSVIDTAAFRYCHWLPIHHCIQFKMTTVMHWLQNSTDHLIFSLTTSLMLQSQLSAGSTTLAHVHFAVLHQEFGIIFLKVAQCNHSALYVLGLKKLLYFRNWQCTSDSLVTYFVQYQYF